MNYTKAQKHIGKNYNLEVSLVNDTMIFNLINK